MNNLPEIQNAVRHNSDELQSFLRDLNQWRDEMTKKDKELGVSQSVNEDSKLPPIRSHKKIENVETKRKKKKNDEMKSETSMPKRISSYDYDAWDKFDVDKACEEVEEAPKVPSDVSDDSTEDEDYEELRRRDQANEEKEKGNSYYKMGRYDQAIECYTNGLLCDPTNVFLPANRALALIKLERYAAAEQDCSLALSIDDKYVKALQRRGTARLALKKYEDAKNDFLAVLKLEPNNVQSKLDLQKVNKLLKGEMDLTNSNSKSPSPEIELPHLQPQSTKKKVFIEEVNSDETEIKSETSQPSNVDPAIVIPIDKPPHLRSKKPLKRIKITECEEVQQQQSSSRTETSTKIATISDTQESTKTLAVPTTSFQFQADWRQLRRSKERFYHYLKAIPCDLFPKLFQHSMEVDVLSDILNIYHDYYLRDNEDVGKGLVALTKVQRFQTLVMLLSRHDKQILKALINAIQSSMTPEELVVFKNLLL